MPVTLEDYGIDKLSVEQRLELIDLIYDSIPEQSVPVTLSPDQFQELARRREAARANPGVGRPWREVLAELEARR